MSLKGREREKKIIDAMPMVYYTALKLKRILPHYIDTEELVSEGYVGLMQAANRFDPKRNNEFNLFAAMRIRGAMLDWVRSRYRISESKFIPLPKEWSW